MKHYIALFLALLPCLVAAEGSDIRLQLSGRLLMDGGIYANAPKEIHPGFHISDVRLAAKGRFYTHWYTKVDVGFANNKVTLKDAYLEYGNEGHYIRGGYMLGFFSMDESTSTNDFFFHTGSNVTETFYPDRRIGFSYTRAMPDHYFSVGAFSGDGLNFTDTIRQGYNFTGRVVWRPVNETGHLFHIGGGALFKVPDQEVSSGNRSVRVKSKGVTYITSPRLLDVTFDKTRHQTQSNVECLFLRDKWMVQSEMLLMTIKQQQHTSSYKAYGGYIQGGYLIKGNKYGYDLLDAVPVMPTDPHSLLVVCRYNHTNLNDNGYGIEGGSQHDISLGVNYYFNEYISSRLNYNHLWLDEHSVLGKSSFHMLQLRLQVRF